MEPIYHWKIEQGTAEWDEIRLGKLTGSDFHLFLGKQQEKKDEKLAEKATERVLGDTDRESFTTKAMERGHILEPEARRLYQALTDAEVKEVGFVTLNSYVGCSPDGIVENNGIIEIKCPMAKNFLLWRNKQYIKPEYRTQIQFNLYVTNRDWCDFFVYHPRLGYYMVRVEKDLEYQERIKETIDECITKIKEYEEQCLY